jgi:hypothetical protein
MRFCAHTPSFLAFACPSAGAKESLFSSGHGGPRLLVDCCYRIDAEQMGVLTREIVLNCGRGVR